MSPDELEEGIYQVYKHTTSRITSFRRALGTLVRTNPRGTYIAHSLNRGLGSLAARKYRFVKQAMPATNGYTFEPQPVDDSDSQDMKPIAAGCYQAESSSSRPERPLGELTK
jgi:hypothetical protein